MENPQTARWRIVLNITGLNRPMVRVLGAAAIAGGLAWGVFLWTQGML